MSRTAFLSQLAADRRGGLSIIGALSLTGVAGMAGLAMETSHGYAVKVDNQRIADAAALAGGLSLVGDFTSDTKATASARAVARANGIAAADTTSSVSAPDAQGRKTVTVVVDTDVPLSLTRVITDALSFNVVATGKAMVSPGASSSTTTTHPNAGACFLSLDTATGTTYGVSVTGAATIVATTTGTNGCDVQAVRGITTTGSASIQARNIQGNGNILIDGSAYFRAAEVDAGGTLTKPSWNSTAIVTSPTANNWFSSKPTPISDPLATGAVQTALAKVTNTANYPVPSQPAATFAVTPTASSMNWNFSGNANPGNGTQTTWRTANNTWEVPYSATGYKLQTLTVSGTTIVRFAPGTPVTVGNVTVSGSSSLTVQSSPNCSGPTPTLCNSWVISGNLSLGGSGSASFGTGTYRVAGTADLALPTTIGAGEFSVLGTTTFGPYTHTVGAGLHRFGRLVVSGSGNVTMGDGNFESVQDVTVGGSARLVLGAGTKTIGANASGQSIIVDGSTLTSFGTGNITVTGAVEIGGSTTVQFGTGAVWIGSRVPLNNTLCTATYNAACRAIYLSGSSNLSFADGTFRTTGGIETGGTSNLTFGSTANHWIRGNMLLNGGVTFGSGAYSIYGYFTKTASMSATGSSLSFFLSGPIELSGSAGSTFAAPTSTTATSDALADILFASLTTAASTYSGSSQNSYTGAVYTPNSNFTISGSGRIVSSGCFALIAKTISITGSGAGGSRCAGIAAAGATTTTTNSAPTVTLIR